jgi:hypothetical protein
MQNEPICCWARRYHVVEFSPLFRRFDAGLCCLFTLCTRFFWLATAGIAGYAAWYYSKHSISPFEDFSTPSNEIQETTKDAFSSNDEYAPINRSAHPHEDYDEEDIESRARHGRSPSAASSAYNSTYSRGEDPAHPGTPLSWAAERQPYVGIGGHAPIAPHGDATMPTVEDYSYGGARI